MPLHASTIKKQWVAIAERGDLKATEQPYHELRAYVKGHKEESMFLMQIIHNGQLGATKGDEEHFFETSQS